MASGNGREKVIASPTDIEMASVVVGNGSHAAMSLPVGMERGMAARPMIVPKSFQSQMSDLSQQQPLLLDVPSSEDEYDVEKRQGASLNPAAARKASYGATSTAGSRLHLPPRRRHRRHHSSSVISVASLDRVGGASMYLVMGGASNVPCGCCLYVSCTVTVCIQCNWHSVHNHYAYLPFTRAQVLKMCP